MARAHANRSENFKWSVQTAEVDRRDAGRARIAAAQRARWAKFRAKAGKTAKVVPIRAKRTLSAAARKKIAAAQKARWAKVKAGKKAT